MKLKDWKRFSSLLQEQGLDLNDLTFDDEAVKKMYQHFKNLNLDSDVLILKNKKTISDDMAFFAGDILIHKATTKEEMGYAIEFDRLLKEMLYHLKDEDRAIFLNTLKLRIETLKLGEECLNFLIYWGKVYQVDVEYFRVRIRSCS